MVSTRIDSQRVGTRAPVEVKLNSAAARTKARGLLAARAATARADSRAQSLLRRLGNTRNNGAARKPMGDRRVRGGKSREQTRESQVDEYFDALDDPGALQARMSLQEQCMNGDNPRQSARQFFDEIAEQYLALESVLNTTDWSARPELRERLEDALAEFMAEEGDVIHAALNSVNAAADFARQTDGGANNVRTLQHVYEDIVFDPERNLSRVLNIVTQTFPKRTLSAAVTAIRTALGDELNASRQSAPGVRLRMLVADLYYVSVATTALLSCGVLAERVAAYGGGSAAISDEALVRQIASWTGDRWLPTAKIVDLVNALPKENTKSRIVLLTGVRKIASALPDQIFIDNDHRLLVAEAVQQVLDETIDVECAEMDAHDALDSRDALPPLDAPDVHLRRPQPLLAAEPAGRAVDIGT